MKLPQNFSSVRVHRSRFEYKALGLVLVISPSYELEIVHHFFFFFMDSFFFKEHSIKILDFFSTSSTAWEPVQPVSFVYV